MNDKRHDPPDHRLSSPDRQSVSSPTPQTPSAPAFPLTRRQWLKAAVAALFARLVPWNGESFAGDGPTEGAVTAVYLTWSDDPTTTMDVFWHTVGLGDPGDLLWRQEGQTEFQKSPAKRHPFPYSNRSVNRTQLKGLKPDTLYFFRVPNAPLPASASPAKAPASVVVDRSFRTAPSDSSKPVNFVIGGDVMRTRAMMAETCLAAAKTDPLFVVIGGDLAYEDGLPQNIGRWYDFFDCWTQTMITPSGRVIPLIPTIGNHEVRGAYNQTPKEAVGYYVAFGLPMDEGTYRTLDFGSYLSFILLDSGHTAPINGKQTAWLSQQLDNRTGKFDHLFPVYHVPAYPGHGPFNFLQSVLMRECWSPLFDKSNIDIVFENHDHLFHRSKRIRAGKADPTGVLYLGDGCWGVEPRDLKAEAKLGADETWYIESGRSVRHFMLLSIQGKKRTLQVIDSTGAVIDQLAKTQRQESIKAC